MKNLLVTQYSAVLHIYFDGIKVRDFDLKSDMYPQQFDIDVTGVRQVKLILSGGSGVGHSDYALGNPVLEK